MKYEKIKKITVWEHARHGIVDWVAPSQKDN